MSGKVINIAPRQKYSFNNAASQSTEIKLGARAYSVSEVVSGTLIVRVSADTSLYADSLVNVGVFNSSLTSEEPSILFVGDDDPLAGVEILAATDVPKLYTASWNSGTAAMVTVALFMISGATPGPSYITLAVDLVLRDA